MVRNSAPPLALILVPPHLESQDLEVSAQNELVKRHFHFLTWASFLVFFF